MIDVCPECQIQPGGNFPDCPTQARETIARLENELAEALAALGGEKKWATAYVARAAPAIALEDAVLAWSGAGRPTAVGYWNADAAPDHVISRLEAAIAASRAARAARDRSGALRVAREQVNILREMHADPELITTLEAGLSDAEALVAGQQHLEADQCECTVAAATAEEAMRHCPVHGDKP